MKLISKAVNFWNGVKNEFDEALTAYKVERNEKRRKTAEEYYKRRALQSFNVQYIRGILYFTIDGDAYQSIDDDETAAQISAKVQRSIKTYIEAKMLEK